ncbi:MarR family winged helix-turn-helix transcriptional regulator [Niveispirillum sp. KHB5.9]|uniref:MarR family winged helix-turn-helix transcriptional regulator n=1 Tax=Niveispirillum sp. KHB5.9 TaxID=3400269 RepID=UPI003A889720
MNNQTRLEELPGFLVRRLGQISTALFLEETAGLDLTPPQYGVLMTIAAEPGRDQTFLSCRTALDRATITGVVDRLETRGLIRREVDPDNRRARLLYPTPDGLALLDRTGGRVDKVTEKLLSPLPADEQRLFLDLLRRLVEGNNQASRVPMRAG